MKTPTSVASAPIKQITVLLADNQAAFRKSLKLLVEAEGDIAVVGEAKNGVEAVALIQSLRPEVVVMDISMPLLNGLEATRQIMEAFPDVRVLVLSAHPEPEYVKRAMLSGASGYLIKQSSTQVLTQAVREVAKGNSFFCAPIAKPLRDDCRRLFDQGELRKKETARLALSTEAFAY